MSPVTAKRPYYTTFRRKVRTLAMPASREIPLVMIQTEMRSQLNEAKHSVIENSWRDAPGYYTVREMLDAIEGFSDTPDHRTVYVRYVTGGMRHGLGASTELSPSVGELEFSRAHGPGFGR